jgi:hypothetical protein
LPDVCRFRFPPEADGEVIEAQLALAIVAAESAFGQPKVRISAAYSISKDKSRVVIDVATDVGQQIAQIFAGLMMRQLGEDGFSVDRLNKARDE